MNILRVKITVLSNIVYFSEKWLITGLGMENMSLEHLVQETRKCSKNDRDVSKGLKSQLEEAPMAKSGII